MGGDVELGRVEVDVVLNDVAAGKMALHIGTAWDVNAAGAGRAEQSTTRSAQGRKAVAQLRFDARSQVPRARPPMPAAMPAAVSPHEGGLLSTAAGSAGTGA